MSFQSAILQSSAHLRVAERLAPDTAKALFQIAAHLSRRPATAWTNLRALLEERSIVAGSAPVVVTALRDWFIQQADVQLQQYYRRELDHGSRSLSPEERISHLAARHDAAREIVSQFDWHWLSSWLEVPDGVQGCLDRLSNFAFPCTRVNLRFTYHCNIACAHCYNSSGPAAKQLHLALDTMLRIVAEMPTVRIRALNITGGEPMLYPDEVCALVRAGRAAGLREISIFTNAFWAKTSDTATAVLRRLQDAGFGESPSDYLKASGGVYHEEFIEFDRLVTLARSYSRVFGRPLLLDLETSAGAGPTQRELADRIAAAGLQKDVAITFRSTIPIGRGADLTPSELVHIDYPCPSINQIVFEPDGSARPCCGLNSDNNGVRIGSTDNSLQALMKRMQNDPLLQFIGAKPMSELFKYVPRSRNLLGYASPCNLCQDAVGSLSDDECAKLRDRLSDDQKYYPFWFNESDLLAAN